MKGKILFLTSRLPYPPTSGRKVSLYYYCKYLNELYDYKVIIASFCEVEDKNYNNSKPDFIDKVYLLNDPSNKEKIINLLTKTFFKKVFPMQVSLYYSKSVQTAVNDIVKNEMPDIIITDMVRTSEYAKDFNVPKILDMDDLLSVRYERQKKLSMGNINPYGAYLSKLPRIFQKILLWKPLKSYVMNLETKLIKKYEKNISEKYDAVVFVAKKEANKLNNLLDENKCFDVPLGVNIEYFGSNKPVNKIKNSISFLGAMNVAHNEEAVIFFCEKILPIIRNKINDIRFYIIGGGVTERVKKLASDNVIITGRVDDVRVIIKQTNVFVCPLLFGSGIKTKNLEAMAMKVPIVTTSIGAESIEAENDKDWFVRDNEVEFAESVIELINNQELADKMAESAYNYVLNNFEWLVVAQKWENVLNYIR